MLNSTTIKNLALTIGFDACGIVQPSLVDENVSATYNQWLTNNFHGSMNYLETTAALRFHPQKWYAELKSIVVLLFSYHPKTWQTPTLPQISCYAYGTDYHRLLKRKLKQLLQLLQCQHPHVQGLCAVDTAPIMERYWAVQAGLGYVGKNAVLINPVLGSFVFIAELFLNENVDSYDKPLVVQHDGGCGACTICMDACPAAAIVDCRTIDARKCISYTTQFRSGTNTCGYIWGCDICQRACPKNKNVSPTKNIDWNENTALTSMTTQDWLTITEDNFSMLTKNSPMKRTKLEYVKSLLKNVC